MFKKSLIIEKDKLYIEQVCVYGLEKESNLIVFPYNVTYDDLKIYFKKSGIILNSNTNMQIPEFKYITFVENPIIIKFV
jgi:hypothetical protein